MALPGCIPIPAALATDIGRPSVWSNQCNGLKRLLPNWIGQNLGPYRLVERLDMAGSWTNYHNILDIINICWQIRKFTWLKDQYAWTLCSKMAINLLKFDKNYYTWSYQIQITADFNCYIVFCFHLHYHVSHCSRLIYFHPEISYDILFFCAYNVTFYFKGVCYYYVTYIPWSYWLKKTQHIEDLFMAMNLTWFDNKCILCQTRCPGPQFLILLGMKSIFVWQPEAWFNIKMSSYQFRISHCGDKMVIKSSYLYNGISYTGKMTSLHWFDPLELGVVRS